MAFKGPYPTKFSGNTSAMVISHTTFSGGVTNAGTIGFGAQTTLAYSQNAASTGGTLTVTDGRQAAAIALLGSYMAGSFVTAADGHGGTLISAAQTQQPLLTHPPHG